MRNIVNIILAVITLSACSPPPEQPALRTYGTGTPTCIIFCTASAIFADLAEGAQMTTTGGDKTGTKGE